MSSRRKGYKNKTASRLAAVQALYEMEISNLAVDRILARVVSGEGTSFPDLDEGAENSEVTPPDLDFLLALIKGVDAHRQSLDEMIAASLPEAWPLDRIEILLKNLLRAGVQELAYFADVPARVVITEYVELANDFFDSGEASMVNAVLDRLGHILRGDELNRAGNRNGR